MPRNGILLSGIEFEGLRVLSIHTATDRTV
jgi:hypothetical protein